MTQEMRYISTRGTAPELGFDEVVLAGLADDGGLYVPKAYPQWQPGQFMALAGQPYETIAVEVMRPFVSQAIADQLPGLVAKAYASFRHCARAPLVQIGADEWVLELFHGPTLAFKDFALQLLGHLLDAILAERGRQVTVVGATSGDTGSAAIHGLRGREHMQVFILHPKGRVSDVQRRQMTTVADANVHNIAIEGSFDDCQALVKAMFGDAAFRQKQQLTAVNSINWARIMAQIVYYVSASLSLGAPGRQVSFCVPTGNFGDIFAGYVAEQMGLPLDRLIVATNRNDILTRFMESGAYTGEAVVPTIAPSMDIQVSSNFERLLFDMHGRDGALIAKKMQQFKDESQFEVTKSVLGDIRRLFDAGRVQEDAIHQTIDDVYRESGMLLDPHTAIAVKAGRDVHHGRDSALVHLATAHPAKFPDAVEAASEIRPQLPPHMADLFDKEERFDVLPNALETVQHYIAERTAP